VFFRSIVGSGLGTVLFRTSLAALREAGLSQAYGISREKSTAAASSIRSPEAREAAGLQILKLRNE
jgi:hypothetical protein